MSAQLEIESSPHGGSPPWRRRLAEVLSLDLRSLALLRVSLGVLLLLDALGRLGSVAVFYGAHGLLPPDQALRLTEGLRFSLTLIQPGTAFQVLLLLLWALAALALIVGLRTRLATLLCWLLALSFANRHPLLVSGGDELMLVLLFWGLFLPWQARWSVDALRASPPPPADPRHLSLAGTGLLLSLLGAYALGAWLRSGPEWIGFGSGLAEVLSVDRDRHPLGGLLAGLPGLAALLTAWLWLLTWLGPWLALSPWATRPLRFLVLVNLALLQLLLIFTQAQGLSPWVGLAGLSVLIGGWFWDWRERLHQARQPAGAPLRLYYDRDDPAAALLCRALCQALILPRAQCLPAQDSPRVARLVQANQSWVVIDHDESAHLKWSALRLLLQRSPLGGPRLARLLGRPSLQAAGDRLYARLSQQRGRWVRRLLPHLQARAQSFAVPALAERLALPLLVLMLVHGLAAAGALPARLGSWVAPPLQLLRLDGLPDAQAPSPAREDGWVVAPGVLASGEELEVLSGVRGSPRYDKPGWWQRTARSHRWRAYEAALLDPAQAAHRGLWAEWLCRDWNQGRAADDPQRLSGFRLTYMLEPVPPGGGDGALEQRILWRQDCPAG
ncbi:MAG TPA: hypothetical protein VFV27_11365 [Nevskiaceae bacterium]|nr:hypothetical protein [Nevskiaceae bacterium]